MKLPTFEEVVAVKQLTKDERMKDYGKLTEWNGSDSGVKLCGNAYLQHYQTANIFKTSFEGRPSLYDTFQKKELLEQLYKNTCTKDEDKLAINMPQAFTRRSPVCFFKPSIAKYLYQKFNATKVLDMTAGWGGRMIGALACGIDYVGIDTNVSLKDAYDQMITELSHISKGKARMIWNSWKDVDLSQVEFDFMMTSPPYFNKEVYENMTPFKNKDEYYNDFLIPMIQSALEHIQQNGWVCININPEFYDELVGKYKFPEAQKIEKFQQSTRKKDGEIKYENVYCWTSNIPKQVVQKKQDCVGCADCLVKDAEIKKLKEMLKLALQI